MPKQRSLPLGSQASIEKLWDQFPHDSRQQVIKLYALLIARAGGAATDRLKTARIELAPSFPAVAKGLAQQNSREPGGERSGPVEGRGLLHGDEVGDLHDVIDGGGFDSRLARESPENWSRASKHARERVGVAVAKRAEQLLVARSVVVHGFHGLRRERAGFGSAFLLFLSSGYALPAGASSRPVP